MLSVIRYMISLLCANITQGKVQALHLILIVANNLQRALDERCRRACLACIAQNYLI